MVSKPSSKKSSKAGEEATAPSHKSDSSKKVASFGFGPAVVPFSPDAAEALRKITSTPASFNPMFQSMESLMANYKNQYEKMTGDSAASLQQGMECCTKASAAFAKGGEQMIKTITQIAQESAERNSEAMKALMACRTLNEMAEAQSKMMQQNFDECMSSMTKLSEMAIKICTEACEPLNGQMTKAMKKASESMAA